MKIEINNAKTTRPFHLVGPATCFIPDLGQDDAPDGWRNVWIKLDRPYDGVAVNLSTGVLLGITGDTVCEIVNAKVVAG